MSEFGDSYSFTDCDIIQEDKTSGFGDRYSFTDCDIIQDKTSVVVERSTTFRGGNSRLNKPGVVSPELKNLPLFCGKWSALELLPFFLDGVPLELPPPFLHCVLLMNCLPLSFSVWGLSPFSQERSGQRYNFLFNFVKICTDLCIAWARQAGRKGRGEFRRCWQIKIFHGKMTGASVEGIGLPQTWGGWCRSSLDCFVLVGTRSRVWCFLFSRCDARLALL